MKEEDLRENLKEIQIPEELDDRIKAAIRQGASKRKEKKAPYKKVMALIAATLLFGVIGVKEYKDSNKSQLLINQIDDGKKIVVEKRLPTLDSEEKFMEIAEGITQELSKEDYSGTGASGSYSTTNNQVEGVDEQDIIKTDGKYIFSVDSFGNHNYIHMTDASNPEDIQKVWTIDAKDSISGLFLYKNNLIILKHDCSQNAVTKIDIYDYSNPKDVRFKKEIELTGYAYQSRLIGEELILISVDHINYNEKSEPIYKAPYIIDDGVKTEKGLKDIKYCPGFKANSFMSVINVNLKDFKVAKSETMMASYGNVYVSQENMYLSNYDYKDDTSLIYKFSIKSGVKLISEGKIKGRTLNQFSMDEYKGNLRIALTEQVKSENDKEENKVVATTNTNTLNSVVVLDNNMKEIGRLGGLGKGEIIHSARFIGDKAYIVTFKRTDPLYIVDMSDPKELKLLGELKTPGVSKYLHPIDDKTLIGFGEDRDDLKYEGLKLSIFSVEGEPKELHNLLLKKTVSPAVYNHKSFFYSYKHSIMAFEIYNEYLDTRYMKRSMEIYKVDKEKGFEKMLTVPIEVSSSYSRALYINDGLYVVTRSSIKAFHINTFEKMGEIELK